MPKHRDRSPPSTRPKGPVATLLDPRTALSGRRCAAAGTHPSRCGAMVDDHRQRVKAGCPSFRREASGLQRSAQQPATNSRSIADEKPPAPWWVTAANVARATRAWPQQMASRRFVAASRQASKESSRGASTSSSSRCSQGSVEGDFSARSNNLPPGEVQAVLLSAPARSPKTDWILLRPQGADRGLQPSMASGPRVRPMPTASTCATTR